MVAAHSSAAALVIESIMSNEHYGKDGGHREHHEHHERDGKYGVLLVMVIVSIMSVAGILKVISLVMMIKEYPSSIIER